MPKKFSIETLAQTLEQHVPEIDFALLFGSAKTGSVKASSDIDIGVFLTQDKRCRESPDRLCGDHDRHQRTNPGYQKNTTQRHIC